MTLLHAVYIPAVFMVGLVTGWILGSRAARSEAGRSAARLKR
jgi:hypothetical protein